MIQYRQNLNNFAFYLLDQRKQRGFHLLNDLRYLSSKGSQPINLIFDIGANVGQSTIGYKKYFPESIIYSFEPVDATFNKLQENTKDINNVFIHNLAFSDQAGEKEIFLSKSDCINSLRNEVVNQDFSDQQKQLIKINTVDYFCNSNNIEKVDLLKTDTEGFDLKVLQGASNIISKRNIQFIIVEVSFDCSNELQTNFESVNRFLYDKGYGIVGFYDFGYKRDTLAITQYCNALYMKI
ncbi:MAG: FkbM family methyltransferase [Cyanobacteria bacterium P01_F01_bin.150]